MRIFRKTGDWWDDYVFPNLILFVLGFMLGVWLAGGYS